MQRIHFVYMDVLDECDFIRRILYSLDNEHACKLRRLKIHEQNCAHVDVDV